MYHSTSPSDVRSAYQRRQIEKPGPAAMGTLRRSTDLSAKPKTRRSRLALRCRDISQLGKASQSRGDGELSPSLKEFWLSYPFLAGPCFEALDPRSMTGSPFASLTVRF